MAGGFLNAIWCLYLGLRNRSWGDFAGRNRTTRSDWNGDAAAMQNSEVSLGQNYLWAGLAGAIWYVGFMLYGMGTTFMGRYDFTSWSIHLAFVIVFSTLCGIAAKEWNQVSRRTALLVALSLVILVGSTYVIALGNRIASQRATAEPPAAQPATH